MDNKTKTMGKGSNLKLQLSKETLRKLSNRDLSQVAGGASNLTDPTYCGDTDCLLCPRWAAPSY
ncbi:MAG TPA: class I lanthipeptide [Polyangia bacterium]|jgi:hypothetical protein|nr:class I lanthipeptide [Polyangia bacterium]